MIIDATTGTNIPDFAERAPRALADGEEFVTGRRHTPRKRQRRWTDWPNSNRRHWRACMHGSAWQGDGARLLRALESRLAG